jgi:hypothetical protein
MRSRYGVVLAVSVIIFSCAGKAEARLFTAVKQLDPDPVKAAKLYQDKFMACSKYDSKFGLGTNYGTVFTKNISNTSKAVCINYPNSGTFIESTQKCLSGFTATFTPGNGSPLAYGIDAIYCADAKYYPDDVNPFFTGMHIRHDVTVPNNPSLELCTKESLLGMRVPSYYIAAGLCLADPAANYYTDAPMVIDANVNNRPKGKTDRLINFLAADSTVAVVSLRDDVGIDASGSVVGVSIESFPSGMTASFNKDVNPATLSSIQFTFADTQIRSNPVPGSIQKNSGNIVIKKGATVVQTIPVSSPFVTIGADRLYNEAYLIGYGSPIYVRDISIDFMGLAISLSDDTAYTIAIDKGLLINKNEGDLSQASTVTFRTGHAITFSGVSPANGSIAEFPIPYAQVDYNGPVAGPVCGLSGGGRVLGSSDFNCSFSNNSLIFYFSKVLAPETKYTLKITGLTDGYAAHDPAPVPSPWTFTTGKEKCYGGTGDGTGSFVDKVKQRACRMLNTSFLCQKTFGCAWDGASTCNRLITCVYEKAPANAKDILCARYAGDQAGCEKFPACAYAGGTCSKK